MPDYIFQACDSNATDSFGVHSTVREILCDFDLLKYASNLYYPGFWMNTYVAFSWTWYIADQLMLLKSDWRGFH